MTVGTASSQNIRRQGNYCLFDLTADIGAKIEKSTTVYLAVLPSEFYPTSETTSYARYFYVSQNPGGNSTGFGNAAVTITTGGIVQLSGFSVATGGTTTITATKIVISNVGYEAKPIA